MSDIANTDDEADQVIEATVGVLARIQTLVDELKLELHLAKLDSRERSRSVTLHQRHGPTPRRPCRKYATTP